MKYKYDYDEELYDEDTVWDKAAELVEDNDLEDELAHYSFNWIWKHLDEEAQLEIWEAAVGTIVDEYFVEVEEDLCTN